MALFWKFYGTYGVTEIPLAQYQDDIPWSVTSRNRY